MSLEEKKEKRKGLAGTLAVHGLLFLLLFLYKIITPEPPKEEGGILINFGTSETGLGTQEEASASSPPQIQQAEAKQEVVTQDEEPTVAIKKNTKKTETPVVKKTEKKPEPVVNPNAIYKGKNSNSKSGSEGVTQGPGNQGDPNGDPSSPNYTGGKGDGIGSFDLKGRSIIRPPTIKDNSQETGKVEVDIVVDKNGNVTGVSIGRKSTTTSSHLQQLALKAARETKFSSSLKGEEIQSGSITFVFVVQ
jgi:TonB family protein